MPWGLFLGIYPIFYYVPGLILFPKLVFNLDRGAVPKLWWSLESFHQIELSQVLFRLSRWEYLDHAQKFDQDAKDRVVRLVEDRILTENMPMQAVCQAVAPKLGVLWHTARQWT